MHQKANTKLEAVENYNDLSNNARSILGWCDEPGGDLTHVFTKSRAQLDLDMSEERCDIWVLALKELVKAGLANDRSPGYFSLTREGISLMKSRRVSKLI